jgi:UDP-glucuronate decarboxylase
LVGSTTGRVLVTGGSGFLGAPLCNQLAATHDVYAPARADLDLLGPVIVLDRYCRENRIEKIVHLGYPRVYTNNQAMGESLTMLRNILDVCKSRGIQLILPSSWVVFSGYRTRFMEADVKTDPRPKGIYGETKFLEEVLVSNAVGNGELAASIVRLSPVYGAGSLRPRIIRFAYKYLLENRPVTTHRYRNGLPQMQMLYVDDAVAGLMKIVKNGRSLVYHLGGRKSYEPREMIACIGAILGRKPQIEEVQIDDHAANVFLDSSAASVELGWNPMVDIDEGFRHTLIHHGKSHLTREC